MLSTSVIAIAPENSHIPGAIYAGTGSGIFSFVDSDAILSVQDKYAPDWTVNANISTPFIGENGMVISWTTALDNKRVTQYKVFMNSALLATVEGNVTVYNVTGLEPDRQYNFRIEALDEAGNMSTDGPVRSVRTADLTAPGWNSSARLDITRTTETGFTVNWPSAIDNVGVTGYKIYLDSNLISDVAGNMNSFDVTGLKQNTIYYVKITAIDGRGNESSVGLETTVRTEASNETGNIFVPINTGIRRDNDNRITTFITLDEDLVENTIKNNPTSNTFVIQSTQTADIVNIELTAGIINTLIQSCPKLELNTPLGDYIIPTEELDIQKLIGKTNTKPEDIKINVIVSEPDPSVTQMAKTAAQAAGLDMVVTPVSFQIEVTVGNETYSITRFGSYVTKIIPLGNNIDPSKSVGGVINPDGTFTPVPTQFTNINGVFSALMLRNGNSLYTVVKNNQTLNGPNEHWAWQDYSLLATKLIIQVENNELFVPDKPVTRQEFVILISRALGLVFYPEGAVYSDIGINSPSAGYIGAATDAGIITGYGDGTFKPDKPLTREEATVIIIRALKYAGIDTYIEDKDKSSYLACFQDRSNISVWAEKEVAVAVRETIVKGYTNGYFAPIKICTFAEAIVMVRRMMERADFLQY